LHLQAITGAHNKPYADVINLFYKPTTFFYLDPSYFGCENYYGDGIFSRDDFKKLSDILKPLRGKFILSINDHPKTREIFREFKIAKVKTNYNAGAWIGKSKPITELLISNY
jgi:DNA adenine methylase